MEMYLTVEKLIDSVTQLPTESTPDQLKKDWIACAIINLMIKDGQIIDVKNVTNAKDIWNALKRIHKCTNLLSKLFMLRKLYSKILDERIILFIYITKIKINKLRSVGEVINDYHISALMLCTLLKSCDNLITA